MPAIIILAAGMGRRFASGEHKAIAPLILGEGSIHRIIRQLKIIVPSAKIVIVTGYAADSLREDVSCRFDDLIFVHNPNFSQGTVLESLHIGLKTLQNDADVTGAWVLFADTTYHQDTLESLLSLPRREVTVACSEWAGEEDNVIGVTFKGIENKLVSIGPMVSKEAGVMLPAVYWPRSVWLSLGDLAEQQVASQWQAISMIALNRAQVIQVNKGHVRDIDTREDLLQRRAEFIDPQSVNYFRSNISKDERNRWHPDKVIENQFIKLCATKSETMAELSALKWLNKDDEDPIGPKVLAVDGLRINLEYVQGIRLYDLLRLFRELSDLDPRYEKASREAALTLMDRCLSRLVRIQLGLMSLSDKVHLKPYPIDTNFGKLLLTILKLLQLPALTPRGLLELSGLSDEWSEQVSVPFRDATPKNILIAIPELSPVAAGGHRERLEALLRWLDRNEASKVRIVDYDFSSTLHLTVPEDDLISLLGHHGSLHMGELLLARKFPVSKSWLQSMTNLPAEIGLPFLPDPARAALAFLVRYLRFGGRKLMYRIINPAGYAVRFRHDEPRYYFQTIPKVIKALYPEFIIRFPEIYSRLCLLGEVTTTLPNWNPTEAANDYYLELFGPGLRFWQESPVEIQEFEV